MDMSNILSGTIAAGLLSFVLLGFLILYIYFALVLQAIAKKTKTPNSWMAWLPIFNTYLMVKEAGLSGWWFLVWFIGIIPVVGFVLAFLFSIWVWWRISERSGHPGWLSILMLIPILNIIIPGVIAWTGSAKKTAKKSAVKKAPAKKAPVKKAAKKTTSKKTPPKKGSVNKTSKKSTVKKKTKKSAVKKKMK